MITISSIPILRKQIRDWKKAGETIAFVPTMGNLHDGHLSLVETAQTSADRTVVSIFVNPLQFGPHEDFEKYPRTEAADEHKLSNKNIDILFKPKAENIVKTDSHPTKVSVSGLTDILCGASRPGHFDGVTTIVAKLFNLVAPDIAVFGQKDYQQALIIKQMVKDLNYDIEIITAPICRENDGLAMSSRNQYLTAEQRSAAPKLHNTLQKAKNDAINNKLIFSEIEKEHKATLEGHGFNVDYLTIRCKKTLKPPEEHSTELVILAAVCLGKTRLIDNLVC